MAWQFVSFDKPFESHISSHRNTLVQNVQTETDDHVSDLLIHQIDELDRFIDEITDFERKLLAGYNPLKAAKDSQGRIDNFFVIRTSWWVGYIDIDTSRELAVATLALHWAEAKPNSLRQTLRRTRSWYGKLAGI